MKLRLSFLLLFPALISLCQPTREYVETNSARKSLQHAQAFINSEEFHKAYKQLKHTLKIKDDFAIAYRELGSICFELKKTEEAIEAYEKSFELDDKLSRAAFFE